MRVIFLEKCMFTFKFLIMVDCLQMVWASTEVVGCGMRRCDEIEGEWNENDDDDNDEDENQNILFLVCNYAPGYESLLYILYLLHTLHR